MPQTVSGAPNFCTIEKVRVVSSDSSSVVRVQKLNQSGPSGQINVSKLKHIPTPSVGAIGFIVYVSAGAEQRACWMGEETTLMSQQQNETDESGNANEVFFTTANNTASLRLSQNSLLINNTNTQIRGDSESLAFTHGQFQSSLNNSVILLRNQNNIFRLGANSLIQTPSNLTIQSNSGLNLTTAGTVTISSGVQFPEQSDPVGRLGPVNALILKASDAKIAIGGVTAITSSAMSLNLTSRRIVDSGNSTTFRLNIVQGDALVSLGMGNLDINTLGATNFASITSGSLSTGFYSKVKTTRLYGEFRNFTSGLVSAVSVRRGEVLVEATRAFTVDSDAKFSISAKGTGEIKTVGKLDITATGQLNLESSAIMNVKSTMLKLQDARIISLGSPRAATPNPSMTGGWCAIPMCPFGMRPHCGDMLI